MTPYTIDTIKRAALDATGGDVEAAFDLVVTLAVEQAIRLRIHGGYGYGRIPPDMPLAIAPKARTEPL